MTKQTKVKDVGEILEKWLWAYAKEEPTYHDVNIHKFSAKAKKELLELILNHPDKPRGSEYKTAGQNIRSYDNFLREALGEK